MTRYLFNGYAKQKGKDEWEQFRDNAAFVCPGNKDPYEYFLPQLAEMFDYWLVEFQKLGDDEL